MMPNILDETEWTSEQQLQDKKARDDFIIIILFSSRTAQREMDSFSQTGL